MEQIIKFGISNYLQLCVEAGFSQIQSHILCEKSRTPYLAELGLVVGRQGDKIQEFLKLSVDQNIQISAKVQHFFSTINAFLMLLQVNTIAFSGKHYCIKPNNFSSIPTIQCYCTELFKQM